VPERSDHITPESGRKLYETSVSKQAARESDRSLFQKIAASDESAFETIFDKYTAILYPFILDLTKVEADAKEIIQEVFLTLWLKRNTLGDIENPGGWLYTIAANEAYSHFKKEARYAKRIKKLKAEAIAGSVDLNLSDIHEAFDTKEIMGLIREAANQLPLRRRQIFQLARLEGYSRREIADLLGISENTVRNQLVEAVEFVQDYIIKNRSVYLPVILVAMLSGI
jgi:RNA polymerase sigma-70 factor (family 1)